MTDFHTHIGLYYKTYYDYHDVFGALKSNGVSEIFCAYLTPLFNDENSALDFYFAVVNELKEASGFSSEIGLKVNFLYWADPLVLKQRPLKEIYNDFDYAGIALHPRLHDWTGEKSCLLTEVFNFAKENKIMLFLHTGASKKDEPLLFEKWFKEFPEVHVQLAHCKAADQIIYLLRKYKNLTGDTAFCPADCYRSICSAGLKNRMMFGTDFPITHWFEHKDEKEVSEQELTENYRNVLRNKKS